VPRAIVILLALAVLLYLGVLSRVTAVAGPSKDTLLLPFGGLWIDLMLLLAIADLTMRTPRWSPLLSVMLLPLAGAALFAAIAMAPQAHAVLAVPILLPPIIALAALWPWLSQWHARMPLRRMLALCWSAVIALSLVTLFNAA
jgi:hypothetical protein